MLLAMLIPIRDIVLVDGQQLVIGGTSAVAPLMAGLIALLNQQNGKPSGFIHPQTYSTPGLCRDITSGDNKTTSAGTDIPQGRVGMPVQA